MKPTSQTHEAINNWLQGFSRQPNHCQNLLYLVGFSALFKKETTVVISSTLAPSENGFTPIGKNLLLRGNGSTLKERTCFPWEQIRLE